MPEILSVTNCEEICQRDIQCSFYSYNHNSSSPHYLHCYLSTGCDGVEPGDDGDGLDQGLGVGQ